MKRHLTLTVMLGFIALSCAAQRIVGNGNMTNLTRSTSNYDAVKCSGFMDFELVKGTEGSIQIQGEENLLDYIVTEVHDNQLVVKVKNNVTLKTSLNKGIKITIPFQDLDHISLSGSGDLWNKDILSTDALGVTLAGSGDVTLRVTTNTLKSKLTGSGDLTLNGSTTQLEASLTGSGDIDASGLSSDDTSVSVSGSGDAVVVSHKALKARVVGSGDIVYSGNPGNKNAKVVGSGNIRKK